MSMLAVTCVKPPAFQGTKVKIFQVSYLTLINAIFEGTKLTETVIRLMFKNSIKCLFSKT